MTTKQRTFFWLLFVAFLFFSLYLFRDILLPFVMGMAIAYFLDPVVDRTEKYGLPRWAGTTVILVLFFAIVIGLLFLLLPLVQSQVLLLIENLPRYLLRLRDALGVLAEPLLEYFDGQFEAGVGDTALKKLPALASNLLKWTAGFIGNLISGGVALANILSLMFITPIVAFYLLRDWDKMTAAVDGWLPQAQSGVIREQLHIVDRTLAGFVRGQGMVCVIQGVFYAVLLSLAGLQFGLVIGLFSGLISFIPFVGAMLGGILSIGLALVQFGDIQNVAIIAAIFFAGQMLEGNFLTPKLVGDAVGLHPVWVIFALLAGGTLFGFVGVMLAVPMAAVIGVLTRFSLERYLASPLHLKGIPPADDEPEDKA